METVTRTMLVSLFVPGCDNAKDKCGCDKCTAANATWRKILDDIKLVRNAKRQIASTLFLLEAAGAEIYELDGEVKIRTKASLEPAINKKDGKPVLRKDGTPAFKPDAQALERYVFGRNSLDGTGLRAWVKTLLPGFDSGVIDCALADAQAVWKSKDPEFAKASRNWLALQFARTVPQFLHSVLMVRRVQIEAHAATLTWRAGAPVRFKVKTLDAAAFGVWKKIVSGDWSLCDPVKFTERDGKLKLIVAYKRPPESVKDLNPARCLEVATTDDPNEFFKFTIRTGHESFIDECRQDWKNVSAVVGWIDRLRVQQDRLENEIKGCGSRRDHHHGSGHAKAFKSVQARREGCTRAREQGTRTWNHTWAKAVLRIATRWHCGKIMFFKPANGMLERPWGWADFGAKLQYRCDEAGVVLEVAKETKATIRPEVLKEA